jgi:hypothetical protein
MESIREILVRSMGSARQRKQKEESDWEVQNLKVKLSHYMPRRRLGREEV